MASVTLDCMLVLTTDCAVLISKVRRHGVPFLVFLLSFVIKSRRKSGDDKCKMKRGKRGTGRHDASIYLSKRSKCIWRSLRLRCWRRKTLRGSDVSCGLLVGGGQLALREFQVIAYDQRHILIEVFDATGNAIYSEIGAEYPARRCAQSRIFHPLPERVMLTQVGLRAIIDAGAQLVVSIQITFRQYA